MERMRVKLIRKHGSTFHDFPYRGEGRKCIHTWIINVTPSGYDHCLHRCVYCYARDAVFSKKPSGEMHIYSNLPELVERDLRSLALCPPISISNTTDPCQEVEALWRVTEDLVRLILRWGVSFCIVTKGRAERLLTLGGFAEQPRKLVAVTIEGTSEMLACLSPGAPPFADRLRTVRRLSDAGVGCAVRLDPLFIHLLRALHGPDSRRTLQALIEQFARAGAKHVVCSTGRLSTRPAFGRSSSLDRIATIVSRFSEEEGRLFRQDYRFDRTGTSAGYLLDRKQRLGLHRTLRQLAEAAGMTYSSCQENTARETDSPGVATCEGVPLPFTRRVGDRFEPIEGCNGNCFGLCSELLHVPCGRPELRERIPLKKSAIGREPPTGRLRIM